MLQIPAVVSGFPDRFELTMSHCGMSMEELGRCIRVGPIRLNHIPTGEVTPLVLRKVSEALGVTTGWLAYGIEGYHYRGTRLGTQNLDRREIAGRLLELRYHFGIHRMDVSRALGFNISSIEEARGVPARYLDTIANYYGMDLHWVLYGAWTTVPDWKRYTPGITFERGVYWVRYKDGHIRKTTGVGMNTLQHPQCITHWVHEI